MSKVLIKAKKGCAESLRPLALKLRAYLDVHPFPQHCELVAEVVQVENSTETFHYSWDDVLKGAEEKSAWQAQLDVWLRRTFSAGLPKDVCSVLLRFSCSEGEGMPNADNLEDGLIKGDGLAEFSAVTPRYSLKDLILSPETMSSVMSALAILQYSDLIYDEWGFGQVDPVRKAVLNFYGPPGTGKTMAAHGIASHLNKRILVANFAEIESKYVGDSPKNLENIFHQARKDDAVLFFDEADSFLGKRLTSISSSSDQAVNSLRSKLLQLLEEHTGIVVFCTNLIKNYDKAFESRILCSIKFDLPDHETRKLLIRQKIPAKVPFEDDSILGEEDISLMAEISDGFSGREIKNAVLKTLCAVAVAGRRSFTSKDFIDGFSEMKNEIEELKKARGAVSKEKADQLSQHIRQNLDKGNFSTTEQKGN